MYISIDKIRQHLNIDDFYHEDDEYINHLTVAAETAVAKRLNVKNLGVLLDKETGYLPEDVNHAVLLLIGNWYSNREAVSTLNVNKLPYGLEFLFELNKNYSRSPF